MMDACFEYGDMDLINLVESKVTFKETNNNDTSLSFHR